MTNRKHCNRSYMSQNQSKPNQNHYILNSLVPGFDEGPEIPNIESA